MTALAPLQLLAGLRRRLLAALDAWSYSIARSRAEQRRTKLAARTR